ncbi:MAG: chemotaxis response regulator protein-glutamate methylesterase [Planctomycetia bacterium]|nr:chemotaxis response regulator protein-glutamate methylesterase [Planctomycetia bacterium]
MTKIRVMVVDDSVVIRRQVTDELALDPAIEVICAAHNGKQALIRLEQLTPDLVILDIEMPEMDGLTALVEIRKKYPRLPVIMFSSLTERGAVATLDALARGASSYFPKPSTGGVDESRRIIRERLVPEIKALVRPPASATLTNPNPFPRQAEVARPITSARVQAVLIGSSTGGPNALSQVFASFPADLSVPVLIAQHMPPMFTKMLAARLTSERAIKVHEAMAGMTVQPGQAYIAPGDYHLTVVRDGAQVKTALNQGPLENSCRPAVDVLFRSAASIYGAGCLAVILTGMGQDGLRGCEAVHATGGQVIAQDEASSVVWGMPGFVARSGIASRILPLDAIGMEIVRRVRGPSS